jgi:hypothetical protein
MKVILSVPDEGYSRNSSCTLNLISTFLFSLLKKEKLKNTKGVIKSRYQRRADNTIDKRTNNGLQNTKQKTKNGATRTQLKTGGEFKLS